MIARNTALTYKGKPVDAKQIGRELGVLYVLEGSVRRTANRVRVNVQLTDVTATGRFAAVLAADVAGYPRLWASMRALTKRLKRLQFKGRLVWCRDPTDR